MRKSSHPPRSSDLPCLLALSGIEAGRLIRLDDFKDPIRIGRDDHCDIVLESPEVSREHAHFLVHSDNGIRLIDLESRNGTYVNHVRIWSHFVEHGDRIQFGPHIVFKLLWQDKEAIEYANRVYDRANCDHLTGLANRRNFSQVLLREWAYAQRHQQPLSLAILDIDSFKAINDSYGHLAGDKVLQLFANRIKSGVRLEDTVARYGGEEFAILLRATGINGARTLAEGLRKSICQSPFQVEGVEIQVTVSIGAGSVDDGRFSERSPEYLIRLADECLYACKEAGGNRVKCGRALADGGAQIRPGDHSRITLVMAASEIEKEQ